MLCGGYDGSPSCLTKPTELALCAAPSDGYNGMYTIVTLSNQKRQLLACRRLYTTSGPVKASNVIRPRQQLRYSQADTFSEV